MSSHTPAADGAPRSLAEALRSRDDASLAALLRARPDLLSPVPGDLTELAARAGTRASVVRALARLDRFALQTAEALAVAPEPTPYRVLRGLLTGDEAAGDEAASEATARDSAARMLPHALTTLRDQALVWGPDDRLRLVRTARELLAPSPRHPSPTGLGPAVAEATAGMSPGRIQEIVSAAGLPRTHDAVSAVASLTALFTDRERMAALLAGAPPDAAKALTRLVWGPPHGQVTAEPAAHLRWLLDRGLLLPTAPGTVVLPREVALHLRGGRAHRDLAPLPPEITAEVRHRPQVVDATAAGQAHLAVTTVEELLTDWDEGGPVVLRAGGLSVRDLKRTAAALDTSEPQAAFWIELAYAAGLLASDNGCAPDGGAERSDGGRRAARRETERYAATPAYDGWLELSTPERWIRLVTAWLAATRTAGLVGGRDGKDRVLTALGPGLDRSAAPEVRGRVLGLLAGLPEGAAADHAAIVDRLRWERPPREDAQDDPRTRIARWTLAEAELLGLTGRGALSSHARALLGTAAEAGPAPSVELSAGTGATARTSKNTASPDHGPDRAPDDIAAVTEAARAGGAVRPDPATAARLLAPLLPEPLDHVLLQADLTAVAPGPLRRPLAAVLGVLADVESKGGATVYRFTPGSVRRALDAGQSAADLHSFLAEHSRTPVPQPLSYLIDDVARRHGHLRIGAAAAYVRCDDDAVLGEILADKRSHGLRLRRLAPTVLAAQTDPASLLDGLRAMGFAPAAESAEGDVLIARQHARRTPERTAPEPVPDGPPVPDTALLGAAVRAIRAGDLASTAPRKPVPEHAASRPERPPRTSAADTLATMQAAVLTGEAVWIGYVNADGAASQRVIAPIRVEGGFVTAFDRTADEVRTYPLHRITGIAELADDQS